MRSSAPFVTDAPRVLTEVALPQAAPEAGFTALTPVAKPQASGETLFNLALRLEQGMHKAALGHAGYVGMTLPEKISASAPLTGTLCAVAAGAGACMAIQGHPVIFVMGVVAAAITLFPIGFALDLLGKRARATPVSVKAAEPMLNAFKSGDIASQAMVTRQAGRWSRQFEACEIAGQELRQQLTELAAVNIPADTKLEERIKTIGGLVDLLPRKRSDVMCCEDIATLFTTLDANDQTQVGALLLTHLFDGEQLRMGKTEKRKAQALYSTLLATQPRNVTSREALQQLVVSA